MRLTDEVLYSARRMTKERKEFDSQATGWQAMFAATLDSMFVLDGDGIVQDLNPAAERQFKITAAEAVGHHLADLLFPLPHRSLDNAAFMQDIAAGKSIGRRQELVVHCGTRQFPVEMAMAEFHVGEERGLIATARDISVQRQNRRISSASASRPTACRRACGRNSHRAASSAPWPNRCR